MASEGSHSNFSVSIKVEVLQKSIRSTTRTSESTICHYLNAHEYYYISSMKTLRCLRHDFLAHVRTLTKFLEHLQNNMSNFVRNFVLHGILKNTVSERKVWSLFPFDFGIVKVATIETCSFLKGLYVITPNKTIPNVIIPNVT